MSRNDNFYLESPEPNKSCLLTLRDMILQLDTEIIETKKYGMPCFCFGKKILCYLWVDKKTEHPYILFTEGRQMQHPLLEQGKRTRMKILPVNPNNDLPVDSIIFLLKMALDIVKS